MIRRNTQRLADVLEEFIRSQQLDGQLYEKRLMKALPEVMGKGMAAHVSQPFIIKGELHVSVDSAVIRHELQLMRSQLISRLNAVVGRDVIKEIRFH